MALRQPRRNQLHLPGQSQPPATGSTPTAAAPSKLWPKPSLAELKATLDDTDAIATLEAVQMALTEVGDGATYVWHRRTAGSVARSSRPARSRTRMG